MVRLLPDHEGHPAPLRQRGRGARRRRGGQDPADPGARDRAGLQAAQADPAGARLRQGHPAQRAGGRLRRRRPRGDQPAPGGVGRAQHRRARSRCCTRRTARSSGRSSTTPPRSGRANPRGVVAVYIPEYVVGRWWEQLLHNQTALRLKGRLLFTPGVMVTSVPYQLRSSEIAREREDREDRRVRARRPASRQCRGSRQRPSGPTLSRAPQRRNRTRSPRGRSRVGERFDADVGPVAHGGHCVVRLPAPEARVVFVRHACRASGSSSRSPRAPTATGSGAVTPSRSWRPRRTGVAALPAFRPGLPAVAATSSTSTLARQRLLKADVVREQLSRLAGLDLDVTVEPVPGDQDGLRWRTRTALRAPAGRAAGHAQAPVARGRCRRRLPDRRAVAVLRRPRGPVRGRRWLASGRSTPAPRRSWWTPCWTLLDPRPGESVLDLYAGVGLFARFLADAVGAASRVSLVEGDAEACRHALVNVPGAQVHHGDVAEVLAALPDEPCRPGRARPAARGRQAPSRRAGGRPSVHEPSPTSPATRPPWPATSRSSPSTATRWRRLRAFDAFPMTSHVECVAHLVKSDSGLR